MTDGSSARLPRLLAAARRWALLLVLAPALSGAAAYAALPYVPPKYEAVLTLLIEQGATPGLRDDQALRTYAERMRTRPVLGVAAERIGMQVPFEDLSRRVSVTVVQDTQLLRVKAEDADPAAAARLANSVGEVLAMRQADEQAARAVTARSTLSSLVEQRREALTTAVGRLEEARRRSNVPGADPEIARLQSEVTQAQAAYEVTIREVEANLLADVRAGSAVQVVAPAVAPDRPVFPQPVLTIGLACLAGLALALGMVALAEQLSDRFAEPEQMAQVTGLPVLGTIPGRQPNEPLTPGVPRHAAASYGMLLRSVLAVSLDRDIRTLMVTSASEGEGKSTVAAGLAITIAESGRKVVLVDADLHGRSQADLFLTSLGKGLAELLNDVTTPIGETLRSTGVPNLTVLGTGSPATKAPVFWSQAASLRLAELRATFDVVILDAPAVGGRADAALLAPEVDAVLVVVEANRSRRRAVLRALETLDRAGARILGLVVNRVEVENRPVEQRRKANTSVPAMDPARTGLPAATRPAGGSAT